MVAPSAGSIVLVRFPFSDLTQSKLRPAVVVASAGRDDWILCQVTSKPYGDARAVELTNADFASGGLRMTSYARPAKLFTAHVSLFVSETGTSRAASLRKFVKRSSLCCADCPARNATGNFPHDPAAAATARRTSPSAVPS